MNMYSKCGVNMKREINIPKIKTIVHFYKTSAYIVSSLKIFFSFKSDDNH